MGLRFRKSLKIAPGLKLNLNKSSVSFTAGTKGAHYTVNSKGKRTTSIGIPGTGLYYTQSSGGNNTSNYNHSAKQGVTNNNTPQSGGCLMSLLKFFGILMLISLFLCFGWILGIIWLLFFRKRMNDNPDKQKKATILVVICSILSVIFTIYTFVTAPPSIESLKISSNVEGKVLKVGKDYDIKISNSPKESSLENIKYHVSGNGATFKTSGSEDIAVLHTKAKGNVTIYVSSGNVKSNSITFKIIDSAKKKTTNNTTDNTTTLTNEPEKAEPAPNTNATNNSTNYTESETSNDAPTTSTTDTTVDSPSTDTTVQSEPAPTAPSTNSNMVWIDSTGKRYHNNPRCSNMSDPYQVTVDEALAGGRSACQKCY